MFTPHLDFELIFEYSFWATKTKKSGFSLGVCLYVSTEKVISVSLVVGH